MKNKIDIVHIYYGTQGASGLYTDEIYCSLRESGFTQTTFVSYYYPFKYGKRIFFRFTDLASGVSNYTGRKYFRALEMLFGFAYCLLYVFFKQPKVVNYSLNASFWTDILFVRALKFVSRSNIIITCHDVVPFATDEAGKQKQMRYRQTIFDLADFLLVHNDNSVLDLERYYGIYKRKILYHSFPIMDLKKLQLLSQPSESRYDFAFIGHLRNEKGINVLIESWKIFYLQQPHATLLIAGNAPMKMPILDNIEDYGVTLKLKFLNDIEYLNLIESAGTIILPYNEGTNSGVVYNLINLDVNIIYSDLEMFKSNPLLNQAGMFKRGNVANLVEKLNEFYHTKVQSEDKINKYRQTFNLQVKEAYTKALSLKVSYK